MPLSKTQRHDIIRSHGCTINRDCLQELYEADRENYIHLQNQYIFNLSYDA